VEVSPDEYIPQLSSVITKVLSGAYKLNHNFLVLSIDIWEESLTRYLGNRKTEKQKTKKVLKLKTIKEHTQEEE